MSEHPNPAVTDQGATTAQLLARAAADYAQAQAAARQKQAQGESGERQGVLPGGGH